MAAKKTQAEHKQTRKARNSDSWLLGGGTGGGGSSTPLLGSIYFQAAGKGRKGNSLVG